MPVRQYIGARYVPRFFENPNGTSEWLPNTLYEPLTVVTYAQNSYTSKKDVPASVGDPSSNPSYWVATGNMNAFIQESNTKIETINGEINDINGKIGTINTNISGINDQISTVNTNLANTDKKIRALSDRKFLFVGDSYIADHQNTCVEIACKDLGITNFENISISGTSFHEGSFISQLMKYSGDRNAITDIFVIGGMNDCVYDTNNDTLPDTINAFFTYAKTNYPNAEISVCFAAHAYDNSSVILDRTWNKRIWTLWMYEHAVLDNGGKFYNDMWTALTVNYYMLGADGVHPSSDGQVELARMLVSYITGNDTKPLFPIYGASGDVDGINLYAYGDAMHVEDFNERRLTSVAGQTVNGSAEIAITNRLSVYVNHQIVVPCVCRGVHVNNVTHVNMRGYLIATGRTLKLKLNMVDDSGWTSYTFASDGQITLDLSQFTIPLINLL